MMLLSGRQRVLGFRWDMGKRRIIVISSGTEGVHRTKLKFVACESRKNSSNERELKCVFEFPEQSSPIFVAEGRIHSSH